MTTPDHDPIVPVRKHLKDLTPAEMHTLIDMLRPKRELHAGIAFLHLVVERDGVPGLLRFAQSARETLDKEGELKTYDFEPDDKNPTNYMDLLKRAKPNRLDRRTFFQTAAWGISGAVFTAWGGLRTIEQITGYASGSKKEVPADTSLPHSSLVQKGQKVIDDHLMGPAEVLVGIALMYEDRVKWEEIKLDEIANAVAEFSDHMDVDSNAPARRRKRTGSHKQTR